ncbi:MAG: hypothetical protein CMC05_00650 [Flavobacteriaceae bacterium]|nr:hypothetical protein [Flavobacteriaceae bacterium]MBD09802.1 hypothetical protein [Flavobacteriaceae bacterium]|tara:strand:- start:2953 stop:3483 length:531 start_codon:yes stop_codon:yes gene_type:complete
MKAIISYTQKVPIYRIIVGIALLFLCIYSLITMSIFNSIIMFVMAFVLLKAEGAEIDLESKTYRSTISFLGIKVGKWKPLPKVEYISVFATNENITVRALSAETTNTFPVIHLNLFYDNNKKITVYETKDQADAFNVASHIADALLIDLLDATEKGDFKWVDKDKLRDEGIIVHTD